MPPMETVSPPSSGKAAAAECLISPKSGGLRVCLKLVLLTLVFGVCSWAPPPRADMGAGELRFISSRAWANNSPEKQASVASQTRGEAQPLSPGNAVDTPAPKTVDTPSNKVLRVGVAGSAPFVVHHAGDPGSTGEVDAQNPEKLDGISVNLWKQIAAEQGLDYRLRTYGENVTEAINGLAQGDIDVVVGPNSITALRAQKVRFSQPYYQAGVSILSESRDVGIWGRIKPLFSLQLLIGIGILVFILGIVGTLIWLAERGGSPEQFPPDPPRGIANGMWCAIVTMSTTGYGDLAPVTFWGRLVAASWMIISLLFATTMVAGIASVLTLNGFDQQTIAKAEQLRDRRVAVAPGSPAAFFVANFGARTTEIQTLDQGYKLLKADKVDAVVFDRPQMIYYLRQNPDDEVAVSANEYIRQGYGFAFPRHSDIIRGVDIEMLRVKESGALARIIDPWLGAQLE